jgi:hypothetical protein
MKEINGEFVIETGFQPIDRLMSRGFSVGSLNVITGKSLTFKSKVIDSFDSSITKVVRNFEIGKRDITTILKRAIAPTDEILVIDDFYFTMDFSYGDRNQFYSTLQSLALELNIAIFVVGNLITIPSLLLLRASNIIELVRCDNLLTITILKSRYEHKKMTFKCSINNGMLTYKPILTTNRRFKS